MDQILNWIQDPIKLVIIIIIIYLLHRCLNMNANNKVKQKGGLLFGGKDTMTLNQLNAQIASTVTDTYLKTQNQCKSEASTSQALDIKCEANTPEREAGARDAKIACDKSVAESAKTSAQYNQMTYNIMLASPTLNPAERLNILSQIGVIMKQQNEILAKQQIDLSKLCKDAYDSAILCSISGIGQDQMVNLKASCEFTNSDVNRFKSNLEDEIKRKVVDESDSLGETVKNLSQSNAFGKTEKTLTIQNLLATELTDTFDKETMNEMFQTLTTNQNLTITGQGGTRINQISQKNSASLIMDYLSKNENYREIFSDIRRETDEEIINKGKGLTDIVDRVADSVDNVVDTVGDVAVTGISSLSDVLNSGIFVWMCICVAAIACLGFGWSAFVQGGGIQEVGQVASELGPEALRLAKAGLEAKGGKK